jgi:ribosome biogenesis GTPase
MPQQKAVVIATFSRRMRLRLEDGGEVDARIKGKRLKPVCGDRVVAEPIGDESDWLITQILERDNALERPNMRGQIEILAANVELLVAVAAGSPKPDWFIVDRYLCAAENMDVRAAVVYNKSDLNSDSKKNAAELREYEDIGYPTIRCSAATGDQLAAVESLLSGSTSIIVGQSGVGKSSIINRILGGEQQRTAKISDKTGEGRHTTVNSMMLTLPGGGEIIDSPGVRDYAPALQSASQVIRGFREVETAGQECRFANCRHLREPGCAVKAAVENGTISARRYESYRRLLNLTEKLEKKL